MKTTRFLAVLAVIAMLSAGFAHDPSFPAGDGPFAVHRPTVSQAIYLRLPAGGEHVFVVDPIQRQVPLQLLVLDDELGRSLELLATWTCAGDTRELRRTDTPFYEAFSRMAMRYRVVDVVGPTTESCTVTVRELEGRAGPYTLAIGEEERFSFGSIWTLLTLRDQLRWWQEGR
jgi:hypothetical protein